MINHIINFSEFLFNNKKYEDAAIILNIAAKYTSENSILDAIYTNMRMCYFLANNVPEAYRILVLQEELNYNKSWELIRDKANFLRYLNKHDEAYQTVLKLTSEKEKNLALGWFLHKENKTQEAFVMTEKSRNNSYWWDKAPEYDYWLWTGQKVKNLVVVSEAGFGDQIIFSRWIPKLKEICENVYYDGNQLSSIICRNFNIKSINDCEDKSDLYIVPIMSIPYILKVDKPSSDIYLASDNKIKEQYSKKYPKNKPIRIGLCVKGEKTHIETNLRTIPLNSILNELESLGEIVNLQKDIERKDSRMVYIPFSSWEDTIALIDTCDFIVTCDTAIAHASSAMGKKTIVLMHAAAYFTWNHNEDMSKTQWYHDAWCIHQERPCIWDEAIVKCGNFIKENIMKGIY